MFGVNELTTTFADPLAEDRLNNLTLMLDQTSFSGFGKVDYRFEYTAEGAIRTIVGEALTAARLQKLRLAIDTKLAGMVRDTAFSTVVTRSQLTSPESGQAIPKGGPSHEVRQTYGVLLDTTVMTDYGFFDLVWGGGVGNNGDPDIFAGQVNGLVGAGVPDGVCVNLARRSGGSRVTIRSLPAAPSAPDDSWEDVVEVSTILPNGEAVRWQTWAGETGGELPPLSPGPHRVRVSARGRDEAADALAMDTYLIELWPAPIGADAILRTSSRNAAYWHGVRGSDQ